MKRFLLILLALVGAMVILAALAAAGIGAFSVLSGGRVAPRTVLEIDFEQGVVENLPDDPLSKVLLGRRIVIRDVVEGLDRASRDDRVVAVVARVGGGMGLAQVQEVRDAVGAFRAAGKRAVAYAETFGEAGPGNGAYYLATAFDEVHLQPSGDVGLTGLIYETPFLRGTLEKLGVEPRMDHRREYKNAMNVYTEKSYTAAHREATETLMNSQFGQMLRGIAEGRGLDEAGVRALADRGPFLGREAVEARLVDGLSYRDEVYDRMREIGGERCRFLYLSKYLERTGRQRSGASTIALIYGVGGVSRGESDYDPVFGEPTMGSDTVAQAFREATAARDVKAIVFRVDSPGGSYVASDTIWRETVRAKEAGKPVIVTMGNVAGSGGYFVAMAADKIVAQPGTITGSIGVLGGKFLTSGFWDKVGLSWDEVHTSANAAMWSGTRDYSPEEWARFQASLDRIYEDFTGKVARGRGLPAERVMEIAKGRIWSGEDAKRLGLVDELGGLTVAFRLAREAVGLAPDARIRVRVFPRPKSVFEVLFQDRQESSEPGVRALARLLEAGRPVARLARTLGLTGDRAELVAPIEASAP